MPRVPRSNPMGSVASNACARGVQPNHDVIADDAGLSFGPVIRRQRRQLDLTQEEVARGIDTSVPYIGHLESEKRHPSQKVLTKLADILKMDRRELFFLANPGTKALVSEPPAPDALSVWEAFRKDHRLRQIHNITEQEIQTLSQVALMGDVRSPRDFIYILNTIRQALGQ